MEPFLISAPQQLLGAYEARRAYGLSADDCHLIVLHRGSAEAAEQLRRTVSLFDWGEQTWLGIEGSQSAPQWWRGYRNLERLAQRYRFCERVFAGFYRSIGMRHFVGRCRPKSTVLLDDGLSTLSVPRLRSGEWNLREHFPEGHVRQLAKKLLQINDGDFPELEYFTIFDLEASEPVRRHRLESFRDSFLSPRSEIGGHSQRALFLGAPLVEDGYIPGSTYDAWLSQVQSAATSQLPSTSEPLLYVAHRRESEARLASIRELGFETEHRELPIEFLVDPETPPPFLASFYSSALANLSVLFGDGSPLFAFRIPDGELPQVAQDRVEDCYRAFRRQFPNIEILELAVH